MKKILIIAFLVFTAILSAQQLSYQMEMADSEISNSLSSFYHKNIGDYTLYNTAYLRYSSEDFANSTYFSRYLRNRFYVGRSWKNLELNSSVYVGYYPDGNTPNHLSGVVDAHELAAAYTTGFGAKYHRENWSAKLDLKYLSNQFKQNDNESEALVDANMLGNFELAAQSFRINPYFTADIYSDMNDSDVYDYQEFGFGIRNFTKVSFAQFLAVSAEVGHTGIYTDIPYYTEFSARLTTKINRAWFIVNRLNLQSYIADDFSEFYQGKNYTEHLVQYNYDYNENSKNYLRAGFQADIDGEVEMLFGTKYYLKFMEVSAEYKHFISDLGDREGLLTGELAFPLPADLSLILADQYDSGLEQNKLIFALQLRR